LAASAELRQGAVIMINANDDTNAIKRIVDVINEEYHWPSLP